MSDYENFFARQDDTPTAGQAEKVAELPARRTPPAAEAVSPTRIEQPRDSAPVPSAFNAPTRQPARTPAPQPPAAINEPAVAVRPDGIARATARPAPPRTSKPAANSRTVSAVPAVAEPAKSKELTVRAIERKSNVGWRGWFNKHFGANFAMSGDEVRYEQLWLQARTRISGSWYTPVIGSGGVTTITMALGSTFAELRGEKVLAIDADPGFGSLHDRAALERPPVKAYTSTDMIGDPHISTYSDCRAYTSMNTSDLEILAADNNPGRAEFTGQDLADVLGTIAGHYQLIFSDMARNLRDSVGHTALTNACGLVIVCGTTLNDSKAVDHQIKFLKTYGYDALLKRSVLVINQLHGHKPRLNIDELAARYAGDVKHVHRIGFDPHLSEGGAIRTELLAPSTRRSFVELAALTGSLIDSDSRGIR